MPEKDKEIQIEGSIVRSKNESKMVFYLQKHARYLMPYFPTLYMFKDYIMKKPTLLSMICPCTSPRVLPCIFTVFRLFQNFKGQYLR